MWAARPSTARLPPPLAGEAPRCGSIRAAAWRTMRGLGANAAHARMQACAGPTWRERGCSSVSDPSRPGERPRLRATRSAVHHRQRRPAAHDEPHNWEEWNRQEHATPVHSSSGSRAKHKQTRCEQRTLGQHSSVRRPLRQRSWSNSLGQMARTPLSCTRAFRGWPTVRSSAVQTARGTLTRSSVRTGRAELRLPERTPAGAQSWTPLTHSSTMSNHSTALS